MIRPECYVSQTLAVFTYYYTDVENTSKEIDVLRKSILAVSQAANIISKYTAFVAVDKEGAKVEGDLVKRSCPVPKLSDDFLKGWKESKVSA